MSAGRRFAWFALGCVALTLAWWLLIGYLLPIQSANVHLLTPVLLCVSLGFAMGEWTRSSPLLAKLGAAITCLIVPFAVPIVLIFAMCYLGPECM